jgi:REP element-mobilizing transposase RayT
MSQSLVRIYAHLIFSTKNRQPFLRDKGIRGECHAYLAGACRNLGSPSLIVGGVDDHVHILCFLSKVQPISDVIRELKRESSQWLKTKGPELASFYWQSGYGGFSISPSHVEGLKEYIAKQEEHHRQETFQDELRRFLKKYGLEYDERYVWD